MKVNLIKKAEYDLKTDDMEQISFNVFNRLSDNSDESNNLKNVIVFNNLKEYNKLSKSEINELLDPNMPIYVSAKGQIFVYLKTGEDEHAAYTTENTTEQS